MEYLLRGGRAVLAPLWNGSYERADGFSVLGSGGAAFREKTIQWVKELRQCINYLETRDDIDADKVGFQGTSFGAMMGPVLLALEPRLKTGILLQGGFVAVHAAATPFPPEIDPVNYAPRVEVPVLMMNGRYDAVFPFESSQVPLFEALGTPESQKRLLTFQSGHSSYGWNTDLYREGIGWLDGLWGDPSR
jgi:dienelactone hydrolase